MADLDVAGVSARLGFDVDDSGANRYEAKLKKLEAETAKPIKANLGAEVDERAFAIYDAKLKEAEAKAKAKEKFRATLGADFDSRSFNAAYRQLQQEQKAAEAQQVRQHSQTASELIRIDSQKARQQSRIEAQAVEEQLKIDATRVKAQIANDALIQRERIKSDAEAERSARRRAEADEAAAKRSIQAADDTARAFTSVGRGGGGGRSGLGSLLSSLGPESNQSVNGLRQLGIAMRVIRSTGFVEAIGAAIQALSTFTAGAVGAASSLGPLTGLLATLPNYGSAAAQALGTIGLAAQGIGPAVTAGLNAQARASQNAVTAGSRQRSAAESLHNASRTLQQDQQAEKDSLVALNQAREQATRDLEDMKRASEEAGTSERAAALQVQEAQKALQAAQHGPNASRLGVEEAQNNLQQARDNLKDVQIQAQRAREDYADAQKKGVEGSDQVVQAQKQVTDAANNQAEALHDVGVAQAGVTTAQEKGTSAANTYAAKLKQLSPAQADFVKYLVKENTTYTALQQAAGQKLFTGVEAGVKDAMANFDVFRTGIVRTSGTLGDFIEVLGKFLGSDGFGRDLGTIMERNDKTIELVGKGLINLLKAVVDVTVAGGDLTDSISKTIYQWTVFIRNQAQATRDNGKMKQFFQETERVVHELLDITENLGIALYNIFKDAYPLGSDMLRILQEQAAVFKDWTESAKGENAIKDYFTNARPAILDAGGLLKDAAKEFFDLGDGRKITPLIDAIRQDLLPALHDLIENASTSFGPAFIQAVSQIIEIFEKLTGDHGPLVVFVGMLNTTLSLINEIIDKVPAIGTAIGALVVAGGLVKALRLAAAISGMNALIKLLRQARTIMAENDAAQAGGTIIGGGGGAAGAIAGGIATGAVARGGGSAAEGVVRTAEGVFIAGPTYEDARRARLAAAKAAATPVEDVALSRAGRVAAGARAAAGTVGAGARALSVATLGEGATSFLSKVSGPAAAVVALLTYMTAPGNPVQKAQKVLSNFTFGLVPDPLSGQRAQQARTNATNAQQASANLLNRSAAAVLPSFTTRGSQYFPGVTPGPAPRNPNQVIQTAPFTNVNQISGAFARAIAGKAGNEDLSALSRVLGLSVDEIQKLNKSTLKDLQKQFENLKPTIQGIQDQFGRFPRAFKQIRAQDILDPRAAAELFGNFNKIREQGVLNIKDLRDNIKFNTDEINKAFQQGSQSWSEAMSKNIGIGIKAVKDGMHDGSISAKDGTEQIHKFVQQNMTLVRDDLDSFSAQGKDKLASNFSAAADAIKKQMDRAGKTTKAGLTQVRQYLEQEMEVYGFSISEAKNIVKGQSYIGGPEEGSAGPTGTGTQPRVKANAHGGMASPYGGSSADDHILLDPTGRPVAAMSGTEGVVNEPQMQILDYALGFTQAAGGLPWGSLSQLWGSGMRHYAGGGMLQLPASFTPTHQTAGLPGYPAIDVFGKPGERVGAPVGGTIARFSGRSPSAGAYEGAGGPFGWSMYLSGDNKATYFLTHFGSRAVKVGQRVSRGQNLGTVGDYPGGTPDHIHEGEDKGTVMGVDASSATSAGAAAALPRVPQPKVKNGGAVGALANQVLKVATGVANRVLASASASGGVTGSFSGDGGKIHPDPAVVAAIRKAIQVTKASPVEQLSGWEAAIVESGVQNLGYGDRDSIGVFQQRPSQGWKHAGIPLLAAEDYFRAAESHRPWRGSAGSLAQAVQRSAFPARYDQVASQARQFMARGGAMRRAMGGKVRKFAAGGVLGTSGARNPYSVGSLRKVTGDNITAYNKVQAQLDTMQKQYTQKDRAYGQSQETFVNETTGDVNVDEVNQRVNELTDLYNLRIAIWHKLEEAYNVVKRIIATYDTIITNLTNSLTHAKQKDRSGIRASISHYKANMKNWQDIAGDLPFDIEDARLDVLDIAQERQSVAMTAPDRSIQDQNYEDSKQQPPDTTETTGLTADQQAQLDQANRLQQIVGYGGYINQSGVGVLGGVNNPNSVGAYGGPNVPSVSPALAGKAAAMGVDLFGGTGSGTTIVNNINTLTPGDPAMLTQIGKTVTSGLGYQGSRSASRISLGVV